MKTHIHLTRRFLWWRALKENLQKRNVPAGELDETIDEIIKRAIVRELCIVDI